MGIPLYLARSGRHALAPAVGLEAVAGTAGDGGSGRLAGCDAASPASSEASDVGDAVAAGAGSVATVVRGAVGPRTEGVALDDRDVMAGLRRWPLLTRGDLATVRQVPILCCAGPNGSGKSLAMVALTLPDLDAGRTVLSTVRLLDFRNPRPCDDDRCTSDSHGTAGHMAAHPNYVPLTDFRQLLDVQHATVLLDEVTGAADARESMGLPVQVRNLLVQLRRRDVVLRWTSPSFMFADVTIRRVTQAVLFSRGFAAVQNEDSVWRDRRLFRWDCYDARDIPRDESSTDPQARLRDAGIRPLVRSWFWRPGSLAEGAYDTRDQVLTLGVANDAGMCVTCGGRRSAPRCSCSDSKT